MNPTCRTIAMEKSRSQRNFTASACTYLTLCFSLRGNMIVSTFRSQNRYDEAEPLYEKSLAINKQTWGENHQKTLTSRAQLAELYGKKRLQVKAAQCWFEVINARERVLGSDHPDVASALNSWAKLLHSQVRPGTKVGCLSQSGRGVAPSGSAASRRCDF